MSQQLINDGTVANDGTGDTLRAASIKINSNFTELYTTAQTIFSATNTAQQTAQSGYNTANSGITFTQSVYNYTNTVNVIAQSAYNAANNILASEYGNSNVALFLTSYTGNISSNVQTSNVIVTGSLSSNTIISNTHTSNTITSNTITSNTITFSDQSKQTTAWLGATPLLSNTSTYGTYKLLVDQNGVVNVPTSRFSTGQVFTPISTDLLVGTSSQYWQFKGDGSGIVFPNSTKQTTAFQLASSVPSTSHGQSGDTANTWAANATYLYFCSQNYTNGANSIWQRVAWSANTW